MHLFSREGVHRNGARVRSRFCLALAHGSAVQVAPAGAGRYILFHSLTNNSKKNNRQREKINQQQNGESKQKEEEEEEQHQHQQQKPAAGEQEVCSEQVDISFMSQVKWTQQWRWKKNVVIKSNTTQSPDA